MATQLPTAGRAGGDSKGPSTLRGWEEQPEADYTVLMGATTYRVMSGYAAEGEPGTDALAALSKVVFSTTLSEPLSWPNTQLVTQDAVEAVREMKDKASKSMRTIGSLTLCRSLLKADLADRFRVVVFPVITGSSGRERIYDGYPDVALDMISSRTFDGRIQLLEYVPTILGATPTVLALPFAATMRAVIVRRRPSGLEPDAPQNRCPE